MLSWKEIVKCTFFFCRIRASTVKIYWQEGRKLPCAQSPKNPGTGTENNFIIRINTKHNWNKCLLRWFEYKTLFSKLFLRNRIFKFQLVTYYNLIANCGFFYIFNFAICIMNNSIFVTMQVKMSITQEDVIAGECSNTSVWVIVFSCEFNTIHLLRLQFLK